MTQLFLAPLGGLGETGALNCFVYETKDAAFVVDCGVSFVDDRYPGVNLIIPDFDYLEKIRDKLKAVVLTHGHEDHIGALAFLLKRFPVPVYATAFPRGIVRTKLAEFNLADHDIREMKYGEVFNIDNFLIEPIFVNHSMMDVAALYIKTDNLTTLHCTDFKIDRTAVDGRVMDLKRFKEIGDAGLDLLLLDSTNAPNPGWTLSESVVRKNIIDTVCKIKGRIVACLFSSNTYRVQSFIDAARASGRKLALTGRSTKEYARVAIELGRLNQNGVDFYDVEEMVRFEDPEVMVLVTGSQGEPRSVLYRLSKEMFGPFKIKEGDTLIMSSRMIPGNEGRIHDMLNHIAILGAEIIDEIPGTPIHASGHARQDELREIFKITKPRSFVPIHGDYRHLKKHIQIAEGEGVKKSLIMLNGDRVELSEDGLRSVGQFETKQIFVSEHSDFFISAEAIRRRKKLCWNGLVIVACVYDHAIGKVKLPLKVDTEGLFGGDHEIKMREDLVGLIESRKRDLPHENVDKVQKFIKVEIRQYFKQRFNLRPEVVVMINEV